MPCVAAKDFKCRCHTIHLLSSVSLLYFVTYPLIHFEYSKATDSFGSDTTVGICGIAIGVAEEYRVCPKIKKLENNSPVRLYRFWPGCVMNEPFLCLEELPDFNDSEFFIINGGGTFKVWMKSSIDCICRLLMQPGGHFFSCSPIIFTVAHPLHWT